jgi:uncharacterized damage-inducible protein DinB
MTPADFHLLFEYNAWANHRVVEACRPLESDRFTRDLGSSFASIRDTLAHILAAEQIWLSRWHGQSPSAMPAAATQDLASLSAGFARVDPEILAYVSGLAPADLERVLEYRNLSGKPMAEPLWQTLQHLANHGTYHRGQVITMLRQLGAKAVQTDLILFYRERAKSAAA